MSPSRSEFEALRVKAEAYEQALVWIEIGEGSGHDAALARDVLAAHIPGFETFDVRARRVVAAIRPDLYETGFEDYETRL